MTQIEDDPFFSSMEDSASALAAEDDSYFYKKGELPLPMNTELGKPSKRKSSCHLIMKSSPAIGNHNDLCEIVQKSKVDDCH